jgi:hypothetical protein
MQRCRGSLSGPPAKDNRAVGIEGLQLRPNAIENIAKDREHLLIAGRDRPPL